MSAQSYNANNLLNEKSPYLLQHAHNPVDWFPWGNDAFEKAKQDDKPIFLSIGYSTCHWCHVMAHESFENESTAKILNEHFISIKVDREERPDIDSVYMEVCQAMTGSGGWPMSIFMTHDKKPFYAGTYFPPQTRYGMPGFNQLLISIIDKWDNNRSALLKSADEIVRAITPETKTRQGTVSENLIDKAIKQFDHSFDDEYGGFGDAPKFPTPHNLLFLLDTVRASRATQDSSHSKESDRSLQMAEITLEAMYHGGIFDHIGYGFSRYSTDRTWLIPHFEKMLYDNALLIMAYVSDYDITHNDFYLNIAKKAADFITREMTSSEGGFFSAQDADSDGKEGAYYALTPKEINEVLGKKNGDKFNSCYGITEGGNFEGLNIPHLTGSVKDTEALVSCLPSLRSYRKKRFKLHLDDKILTAWNGLMITALSQLARITADEKYLNAAIKAQHFLDTHLEENEKLFVSFRDGHRSSSGFLDDYAYAVLGLLNLYQATQNKKYLEHAIRLCEKTLMLFEDKEHGGFYLSGEDNENLILRPKETYDGAMPSGNSVMAYNLLMLSQITEDPRFDEALKRQLDFLTSEASDYPMGHSLFLLTLSLFFSLPDHITVVTAYGDSKAEIIKKLPLSSLVTVLDAPTDNYSLLNNKTTYYICTGHNCLPPTNDPKI